ncbi:MAG: hypothetical protein WDM87_15800 [Terracidiphilus sp.]
MKNYWSLLQLFEDACEVIEVKQVNRLSKWNRAYLKTALLRLNKSFPGLVPATFLIDGSNAESVRFGLVDRVVKSGYGIRRPIDGVMPQATLNPVGREFTASKCYRYVVQELHSS